MTAYARVITIGKNSAMPRTYTVPLGVGVDGTVFTHRVTLRAGEDRCPDCKGFGEIETWDGNPGHRSETERCKRCDGQGIIEIENPEADDCLPASGPGQDEVNDCTLACPTSSGVQPVARAAGDLPRFMGSKTHTVLRSVPKPSASRRPALEIPPDAAQGTLADMIIDGIAVIAGLSIFGIIALFLMVIA